MLNVPNPNSRPSGAGWADADNEYWVDGTTTDGKTFGGPCVINCNNNNEAYAFHTGGCNFLMGDGSVHFAGASMSPTVITILTTSRVVRIIRPTGNSCMVRQISL